MPLAGSSFTTAVANQPYRHNSSTILSAGNTTSTTTKAMTLASTMIHDPNLVVKAVSPNSSGNLGTFTPISGGIFAAKMSSGNFVVRGLTGQVLAGNQNWGTYSTTSNTPARQSINRFKGYQRLHITSWNYVTGAATYGAQRGVTVLASGLNGVTGQTADQAANPSAAVPGELVYRVKGTSATEADYSAKNNF